MKNSSIYLYLRYNGDMKISQNPKFREEISRLLEINNININVADMLNVACSYTDIINPGEINESGSINDAIIEQLYAFYQLDQDNEENQAIMEEFFLRSLKELNPDNYRDNLYVKTIKETGRYGKYALKNIEYAPYQLFPYDEINIGKDYQEYSAIGYFRKPYSYLVLCEGNNIWMSLNPNEIETMKPFIEKGNGHVLVLGLGMGYVPFMLANKNNVKSVTIIEKDQEIINLFNKLIYPHFLNKEKIKIIKDDAINYVSKNQKFDYIFADLWHSPEDGLSLFIKLKRINKNIDCWLETSLIALLRRCMFTLIEEIMNGSKEEDYRFARTATDKVINTYYQKTKNIAINDVDDLHNLLKDETLMNLLLR